MFKVQHMIINKLEDIQRNASSNNEIKNDIFSNTFQWSKSVTLNYARPISKYYIDRHDVVTTQDLLTKLTFF